MLPILKISNLNKPSSGWLSVFVFLCCVAFCDYTCELSKYFYVLQVFVTTFIIVGYWNHIKLWAELTVATEPKQLGESYSTNCSILFELSYSVLIVSMPTKVTAPPLHLRFNLVISYAKMHFQHTGESRIN